MHNNIWMYKLYIRLETYEHLQAAFYILLLGYHIFIIKMQTFEFPANSTYIPFLPEYSILTPLSLHLFVSLYFAFKSQKHKRQNKILSMNKSSSKHKFTAKIVSHFTRFSPHFLCVNCLSLFCIWFPKVPKKQNSKNETVNAKQRSKCINKYTSQYNGVFHLINIILQF